MSAKRLPVYALVAAAALLVVGCSSGGGRHASPITTTVVPTRTAVAPCPRQYQAITDTYDGMNAGIQGLGKRIVPIDAATVRICRYDFVARGYPLIGSAVLTGGAATRYEYETNRLPRLSNGAQGPATCGGPRPFTVFVVTFARNKQQVDLYWAGCGYITNGTLFAFATTWINDLQHLPTGSAATGTVVGTVREVGGPTEMRRQIPGTVIAANTSGKHWRTTTTATQPFSITLPAGIYRFTGTSPLVNSGQSKCFASPPVVVVGGKTTEVEVVCSIR